MKDGVFRDGLTKKARREESDGRELIARGTATCHVCSFLPMLCLVLTYKQVNSRRSIGAELVDDLDLREGVCLKAELWSSPVTAAVCPCKLTANHRFYGFPSSAARLFF